jgi:hypothetical protein
MGKATGKNVRYLTALLDRLDRGFANFAGTAFSEVRHTLATPSNSKDTPFE